MAQDLSELVLRISTDLGNTQRQLTQLEASTAKATKSTQGLSSSWRQLRLLFGAAGGFAAVTALKSVITTFASFDQQMRNVASVAGATTEEMKRLSDASRDMAKTSVFTASEAAQAQYYLASAGMNVNQIISAQSGVMTLAAATGSDLARTSEAVASAISQFGLEAEDATRVSNVYAAAISMSQATQDKLTDSMRYAGPVASALGQSIEQTSAQLMVLYNAGLRGEQAGTGLRSTLLKLQEITPKAAATFKELNINLMDSEGRAKSSTQLLKELGVANMSTAQATRIFGLESVTAAMMLSKSGDQVDFYQKKITGTDKANQMMKTQMEGLQNQFKLFASATEEAAIALGEKMAPGIRSFTTEVTALMSLLGNAIKDGSWGEFFNRLLFGTSKPLDLADLDAQIAKLKTFQNISEKNLVSLKDWMNAKPGSLIPLDITLPRSKEQTSGGIVGWFENALRFMDPTSGIKDAENIGAAKKQIVALEELRSELIKQRDARAELNLAMKDAAALGLGLAEMDDVLAETAKTNTKQLKEQVKIQQEIDDDLAKSTMDAYQLRERELDKYVSNYKKTNGKLVDIEEKVNQMRFVNYSETVNDILDEEIKKNEELGKEALARYKTEEEVNKKEIELAKKKKDAELDYALAMAKATGDSLTQQTIEHERFVNEWVAKGRSIQEADRLWAAEHDKTITNMLRKTLDSWTDTSKLIENATTESLKKLYDSWSVFWTDVFSFESFEDTIGSFFQAILDAWKQLLVQMMAQWSMAGIAGLFKDLLAGLTGGGWSLTNAGKGFGLGNLLGAASAAKSGASLLGGVGGISGLAGYLGLGASGFTGTTGALMATGPAATAAAEAALAAEVAAAYEAMGMGATMTATGTAGTGAGANMATAGLAAGLAGPGIAMLAALGPGMVGMLFNDQISSLLGMGGNMTPEKAKANWAGQTNFMDIATKQMAAGNGMTSLGGNDFGYFSKSAEEAYKAFEKLATVAGYTKEQMDAVYRSLPPMSQKFLDSGKAAVNAEGSIRAMAEAIAVARDNGKLTDETMAAFQNKIDSLASSFGLSGDAARKFGNDIWDASRDVYTGTGSIIQYNDAISDLAHDVVNQAGQIANGVDGINAISNAYGNLADTMGSVASQADRAGNALGGIKGGSSISGGGGSGLGGYHTGGETGFGGIPKMHSGGEFLSWLLPHEYVIQPSGLNSRTRPTLDYINRNGDVPSGGKSVTVNVQMDFHSLAVPTSEDVDRVSQLLAPKIAKEIKFNLRGVYGGNA
uniref:Putative tail protein n=1 Tax=viral metagenome TaxID=1070528 RepID=A0A6H1ZVM3_9ZZZZ